MRDDAAFHAKVREAYRRGFVGWLSWRELSPGEFSMDLQYPQRRRCLYPCQRPGSTEALRKLTACEWRRAQRYFPATWFGWAKVPQRLCNSDEALCW